MLRIITLLAAFYLLFAGQVTLSEILACMAAVAAPVWLAWRWGVVTRQDCYLRLPWLKILRRLACALVTDSWRVGLVLLVVAWRGARREVGHATVQAFRPGGHRPQAAARRAVVTLGASLAPNGVVMALTPDHGLALHRLAPAPPSSDELWPL